MPESPNRGAVLISGASTGIGRACTEHLDGLGFTVFAGVREQSDADSLRGVGSGRTRPLQVARSVEHALTASRPKARYVVGRDAKMRLILTRLLPTGAMDRVIVRDGPLMVMVVRRRGCCARSSRSA